LNGDEEHIHALETDKEKKRISPFYMKVVGLTYERRNNSPPPFLLSSFPNKLN
jgi:hypothetical protein